MQLFSFNKTLISNLASLLAPHYERMDTKYRKAVPMRVHMACAIYKLVQGASLLQCSKLFAIGKSIVAGVLRDIVHAINLQFHHQIGFPTRDRLYNTMQDFFDFYGLPGVVGAIDGTHIHICKPFVSP